jgi:hypothetical protein
MKPHEEWLYPEGDLMPSEEEVNKAMSIAQKILLFVIGEINADS